jgi:hypothetical protein
MNPVLIPIWHLLITDGLWVLVIAGWALLIVIGLEADKPLSGGIPGHADPHDSQVEHKWAGWDRIGEVAGWVCFAAISAALPLILYWVFTTHGR